MTEAQEAKAMLDRERIVRLIYLYCQAVDRKDYEAFLALFHPGARLVHEGVEIPIAGFSKAAFMDIMDSLGVTQHLIGNILLDVDGDQAVSESYLTACHRISAETPSKGLLADHREGIDEDYLVGARYIDRFERRKNVWKFVDRANVHDWHRWETASDRGFKSSGTRGRLFT